jgi:hypothetical protein
MITGNEKGKLVIHTSLDYDGESITNLQKALSIAIEEIGSCERNQDNEYKDALFRLSFLLRDSLLSQSETNVGIGGKPFKKV